MEARSERRSVVARGKTVEDAISSGLAMLGMKRHEVDIEILNQGSRGVLGFGAEDAQVKLLVKLPPAPVPRPEPKSAPRPEPKPAPRPEPKPAPRPEPKPAPKPEPKTAAAPKQEPKQAAKAKAAGEDRPTAEEETAGQVGREILSEVLHLMGIQARVEIKAGHELADEDQPPPIVLNITGEDLGILIGRRGETLKAIQYLVRLMVSHRIKQWTNLVVDVENYLVRRQRTLQTLATRVAERVSQTGRAQALEPMPAYERRLVHIALRNHPQVTTHSIGEGERRKVMIIPKK